MKARYRPEAFFGGLLWGDSLMRFVFVDEAGTSENEPVTIVVGLTVEADQQLLFSEAAVADALGAVPEKFKGSENFVFHATEIWGDQKFRDGWGFADRLAILKAMMSLPRRLQIPVTMSMVRRSAPAAEFIGDSGLSASQLHHVIAFGNCVAGADRHIRNKCAPNEVGALVAEDVPELRQYLAAAANMYRENPIVLPPGDLRMSAAERNLGYQLQSGDMRVSRIRRSVHFVEKGDPLLMLADACAFGFRRFFADQSFGKEFFQAITGGSFVDVADFSGPSSIYTFGWGGLRPLRTILGGPSTSACGGDHRSQCFFKERTGLISLNLSCGILESLRLLSVVLLWLCAAAFFLRHALQAVDCATAPR